MKIESVNLPAFKNSEHLQFMTDVDGQLVEKTPEAVDIAAEYPEFKAALADENRSFQMTVKSAHTIDVEAADGERDDVYGGCGVYLKGLGRHFDPAIAAAAYRLNVQWESFGNLNRATYDQQTAGINAIVESFRSEAFAKDVETTGIKDWIDSLEAANKKFEAVMEQRYNEKSQKDSITKLRDARLRSDKAYTAVRNRINAGIIFNGEAKYSDLVMNINAHIDRYNATLARRK
jgi:hypothetical protein